MAIIKNKKTKYGVNASYWKIISGKSVIDFDNKTACIIMDGWVSEKSRLDNNEPVDRRVFYFGNEDFIFTHNSNFIADAYKKIKKSILDGNKKEINFWADAKDLI